MIEKYKKNHLDKPHICKKENEEKFHYCTKTCPSCGYICQVNFGHEGFHYIKEHGQMINSVFLSNNSEMVLTQTDSTRLKFYKGQTGKTFTCRKNNILK
jgi:hypothetical protein